MYSAHLISLLWTKDPAPIYLGWHWPTDVLMGSVIGVAFASVATIPAYRNFVWRWVEKAWQSYPGILAGAMFLLSCEITERFDAPIQLMFALFKHKRFLSAAVVDSRRSAGDVLPAFASHLSITESEQYILNYRTPGW